MPSGTDVRLLGTARARSGAFAVVMLLVAALVAPAGALWLAWHREEETTLTAAVLDYPVRSSARTVTVGATARPTWSDPVVVRAPAWGGVVTEVLAVPGAVLDSGAPVARVDGVEVRHVVLDSPLYQPVCPGDDVLVAEVRSVLATAGLRTGTSRRLSSTDVAAVREYATTIGAPDARTVTCFDPAWVLVTTAPVGTVASVDLAVGATVPAQGEPVVTGLAPLAGVTLAGDTGVGSIDERLTAEGATVFAGTDLLVAGRSVGVGVADLASPEALATLGSVLSATTGTTSTSTAGGGTGAGTTETGGGSSDRPSSVGVAVALSLRDSQFVVPATAVVSPLGEQACVLAAGTVVPVTVVASSVSGLIVDLGPAVVPETISLSPGDVRCG
ncbi:MAG TPA: hypothetical protein VGC57_03985 [Cellulomonas sp.]